MTDHLFTYDKKFPIVAGLETRSYWRCVLTRDIGDLKKGQKIKLITIDLFLKTIFLYPNGPFTKSFSYPVRFEV
jgi:hypothetical protein